MLNNVIPKRSEGSRIHEMLPVAQRDEIGWHLNRVFLITANDPISFNSGAGFGIIIGVIGTLFQTIFHKFVYLILKNLRGGQFNVPKQDFSITLSIFSFNRMQTYRSKHHPKC